MPALAPFFHASTQHLPETKTTATPIAMSYYYYYYYHKPTQIGVVRPTQAGRAAYGPPSPPASIQKTLSARRPPSRAYQHATVRDLVRARAHSPHPVTSKSCSPDVHRA